MTAVEWRINRDAAKVEINVQPHAAADHRDEFVPNTRLPGQQVHRHEQVLVSGRGVPLLNAFCPARTAGWRNCVTRTTSCVHGGLDAAQENLEAWIGAEPIEHRIYLQMSHSKFTLLERFFEE